MTKFKDPGSALTHISAFFLTLIASIPLLIKAHAMADSLHFMSFFIFILSMLGLYAASSIYHTFDISAHINQLFKKFDHIMIFILIAGTYTPICLIALDKKTGPFLLTIVWGIAISGIIFKLFWVTCPKWISSVLYIGMGWVCILAIKDIYYALPVAAFYWLLAGGIFYTIGGIIYALKLKLFNQNHPYFGSHEIFHVFVMLGSFCHFIVMFFL